MSPKKSQRIHPKTIGRISRTALSLGLCLGGLACTGETGQTEDNFVDGGVVLYDEFVDDSPLLISPADSPGAGEFNFCVGGGEDPNLRNAAWMTYMAANEYAHFGYLAPALNELGFFNPEGTGDHMWTQCALDLQNLRLLEEAYGDVFKKKLEQGPDAMKAYAKQFTTPGNPEGWGTCARSWFETAKYDGKVTPASAFETWLIHSPHPDNYLEFFSGGKITTFGFETGTTQAMFARHSEKPVAIFSFRGTEPDKPLDLVADALGIQIPVAGFGEVHKGFFDAYKSVSDNMVAKLEQLEGTDVEIWVTGHSLGAALATLLSARIMTEMEAGKKYNFKGLYTVGSPRIGDPDFKKAFEDLQAKYKVDVMRFRNNNDGVTAIPRVQDWRHVGTLAYISEGGDLSIAPSSSPSYKGLSIADHSSDGSYYPAIMGLLGNPKYAAISGCE